MGWEVENCFDKEQKIGEFKGDNKNFGDPCGEISVSDPHIYYK